MSYSPTAVCFDCGRRFRVFKNDRLCPGCEQEEWARRPILARKPGFRGVDHTGLRTRYVSETQAPMPSLAIRLHGKRAATHGEPR